MLNVLTRSNPVAPGDNTNKSTGPKTPEGKAASKMNALKHGLLSKEVLVHCYTYRESEEEFTDLHERYVSQLRPVGSLEEDLMDQIVSTQWRLRRVLAAEAGEIAQNLDLSAEMGPQLEACKQSLLRSMVL